ncbi:trihelix transcription factor GT-2 [Anoplophora glabripennis]|uniref:trihelix transcription factor GT-2 n=1 Tax=Anoplophora glabripennis TaxID=217634 RepID=UPI0008757701|nr:trihelix transcription factor GT-2 [Anoplophora glabripennis]
MEPLEIYDAINNKVIRVYVSTDVAEKCRTDTEFAQDLFNKLQDQDIEEGCAVEIETIKSEVNEEGEPAEGDEYESPLDEKINDKEVWSRHETLKLIKIYQRYKDTFKEHKQRRVVWAMIAAELSQYNVFKSAAKCAEKWKNLLRTYKVANEKPNVPTRFQYYQEMKDIFNNTEVSISDSETDEKEVKYTPLSSAEVAELKDSFTEEVPEKESWSRYETLKFLKAFQMLKHMKQNFSKEKHFWSMVSAQLAKDNIHKHHEKCSAKWKNLLRSYRKNLEKPSMPTRFQYFQEMNDVLNDTELEIADHIMRITDDVEKIVDPDQFKTILEEAELETSKDPVSWAADETLKLIEAYKKHKTKFNKCPSKKFVWAVISSELANQGIYRDTEKIENKWKSLLRSYRRGELKGENPRFYFYEEMSEALNDQNVTTTKNEENGTEYLAEDNSMDNTEMVIENSDHAYSENAGYEQIIIQTEPDETEDNENHWSYSETSALLSAYANYKKKFKNGRKSKLWEEVTKELKSVGIHKSAESCEKKWKKMFSVYKIHKLNKTGPGRFQFYQEIDDILKEELGGGDGDDEPVGPNKRCKCSEKRMVEKQNRHIERMQMLKRKLDLEERKVEAFELYVKHFKSTNSSGRS